MCVCVYYHVSQTANEWFVKEIDPKAISSTKSRIIVASYSVLKLLVSTIEINNCPLLSFSICIVVCSAQWGQNNCLSTFLSSLSLIS